MPTVSTLQSAGARVWWKCQQCQASGALDLTRVIASKGADYDLTDRTAACPAEGCTYWVGFYVQQGQRNAPLRTEAGLMREMDRRSAWLSRQRPPTAAKAPAGVSAEAPASTSSVT